MIETKFGNSKDLVGRLWLALHNQCCWSLGPDLCTHQKRWRSRQGIYEGPCRMEDCPLLSGAVEVKDDTDRGVRN